MTTEIELKTAAKDNARWPGGFRLITWIALLIAVSALMAGCGSSSSSGGGGTSPIPIVTVYDPTGTQRGDVDILFDLQFLPGADVTISVEYMGGTAGAVWTTAAVTGTTTGVQQGTGLQITWNSAVNEPDQVASDYKIRITPNDGVDDGVADETAPFSVYNNYPPSISISTPSGVQNEDVTVSYTLVDEDSDPCTITVECSDDGGSTYRAATRGTGGDDVIGLSSSPAGVGHTFVWDSLNDFGNAYVPNVRIRITAHDGTVSGSPIQTASFEVNNNGLCVAAVTDPVGTQKGNVIINYTLTDPDANICSVAVAFSQDGGGSYAAAAPAAGGDGLTGLASSPGGSAHVFVWNTLADIGITNQGDIRIRVTPHDSVETGTAGATGDFTVDNSSNIPPVCIITDPAGVVSGMISISYNLADNDSDVCGIVVQFSQDGGATYNTPTAGPGGSGVTGLATTPAGLNYTWVWDSLTDVGATNQTDIRIRITPFDVIANGTSVATADFHVNNMGNLAPVVSVTTPAGVQTGDVTISYTLEDVDSDPCTITVNYSINGGSAWLPVTMGTGGDGTAALASSPAGLPHTYVWNTVADLGTAVVQAGILFRIQANDGTQDGSPDQSLPFAVDNMGSTYTFIVVDLLTNSQTGTNAIADLLTNDIYKTTSIVFKLVAAGSYTMGDQAGGGNTDEIPTHPVTLTANYYIGVFEMTNRQWFEVVGTTPGYWTADKKPVQRISWLDIQTCLADLSTAAGSIFRLPTEAEWEYACKAGTATKYSYGSSSSAAYMWFQANSSNQVQEVGTKLANPWGLYDMHGNVWEWCIDTYSATYYQYCIDNTIVNDPPGPESAEDKVLRGGCYSLTDQYETSSRRYHRSQDASNRDMGFRIVRTTN